MFPFLKNVPFFSELEEKDLMTLCESVETVSVPAGEALFEEGDEFDNAYIIVDGEVEIVKESQGREVLLAVRGSGVMIGEMALLENKPRSATVRARSDATLYAIPQKAFDSLLDTSLTALRAIFTTMMNRLRENRGQMQQSEKMAQLGTLTAGIAHELNNPAAAVKRGADQLTEAMEAQRAAHDHVHHLGFDESQEGTLHELLETAKERAKQPIELDSMVRSDREYAIETWLDAHNIENPWDIAPNLVNLNFNEESLGILTQNFDPDKLQCVIDALNTTYNVYFLINEISQGSGQISEIVKALKSYSFLDQAPVQAVNVHEGIDNTLLILKNKLKTGINVTRDYCDTLPLIQAHGSELNQVWTNLLDNAADALEGVENSQIIIRTHVDGNWIVVEIEDNGPGIPPEIQDKIFDAFFTTKPPGKGTGMGLDITYRIVVQKHRGDIKLKSEPGKTVFSVWLPINKNK